MEHCGTGAEDGMEGWKVEGTGRKAWYCTGTVQEGAEQEWKAGTVLEGVRKAERGFGRGICVTVHNITMESATSTTIELYNTNHISPYHHRFENFIEIAPKMFKAANQQTFSTVGKGDLVIDIPNNGEYSKL